MPNDSSRRHGSRHRKSRSRSGKSRSRSGGGGSSARTTSRHELNNLFRQINRSGDGAISHAELQNALSNGAGTPFNPHAVRLVIGMFDRRGHGTIDSKDFGPLWKYIRDWQGRFGEADTNGSGAIDRRELGNSVAAHGYEFSSDFHRVMIARFDRTGRGRLLFDDFIELCTLLQSLTDVFRQRDAKHCGTLTLGYEEFLNMVSETTMRLLSHNLGR